MEINYNESPCFVRCCASALPTTFDDSLSYYEALCKLCKKLADAIGAIDHNAESAEKLQKQLDELTAYVNNYFTDLNIQKEIDSKLDAMAQSGELVSIIAQFLKTEGILGFNTISDLEQSDKLIDGSFVRTFGETVVNDGGGALYKVRTKTVEDVVDGYNLVEIASNNLVAEIVDDDHDSLVFDSANDAEMNKQRFKLGMKIKTLGFYKANDGGGAEYIITDVQDGEKIQVNLENGLYAELIVNGALNVKQLGAKCDGVTDDGQIINKAVNSSYGVIDFPRATINVGNAIQFGADKILNFNDTVILRDKKTDRGFFIGTGANNIINGKLTIDGQKTVYIDLVTLFQCNGDGCTINGIVETKNSPKHGCTFTGQKNIFIHKLISHDNGFKNKEDTSAGNGAGFNLMNAKYVKIDEVEVYNNGQNGISICQYGGENKNIVIQSIIAENNGYVDVDIESGADTTINKIDAFDGNKPSFVSSWNTGCIIRNARVRSIYGDSVENNSFYNVELYPVGKGDSVYMTGKNITFDKFVAHDTANEYASIMFYVFDKTTPRTGSLRNIKIEKSERGLQSNLPNAININANYDVNKWPNGNDLNGRWTGYAQGYIANSAYVIDGVRYDRCWKKPTQDGKAGDISYYNDPSTGGTFAYTFNKTWIEIKA